MAAEKSVDTLTKAAATAELKRLAETIREGGKDLVARVRFGFETVLARPPAPEELSVIQSELERRLARYKSDPEAAAKVIAFGESKPASGVDAAELAAYTLTANLLLNLDEAVNRN